MPPAVEPDVRRPKVVLHDHLDGGVRPGTVAELAAAEAATGTVARVIVCGLRE